MIPLKVLDETAPLKSVILGIAESFGGTPKVEETYDPKSRQHIKMGSYPVESDLVDEMQSVKYILENHGVKVYQPETISNYNQIFARDISFVIDQVLVTPPITPLRRKELEGIKYLVSQVKNVLVPEEHQRIEGGDVMLWNNHLFVGYSDQEDFEKYQVARTNKAGVDFLATHFSDWELHPFQLNKSDEDPKLNALHLDCCIQPVGADKLVMYKGGFKNLEDVQLLVDLFGTENIFEITQEEMYQMNSNFFSISPQVVISDSSFSRLNEQFRNWGLKVEETKYREVVKMGGLFRCSTMPLERNYG